MTQQTYIPIISVRLVDLMHMADQLSSSSNKEYNDEGHHTDDEHEDSDECVCQSCDPWFIYEPPPQRTCRFQILLEEIRKRGKEIRQRERLRVRVMKWQEAVEEKDLFPKIWWY